MKNKLLGLFLATSMVATVLSGCSLDTTRENTNTLGSSELYQGLAEDTYYVVNNNKTITPIFIGAGSFEIGTVPSTVNNDRVLWFKDDWKDVPTLYAGDSLVFHTTAELTETFTFERFEDYGYTIGVCKLTETPSGRFKVSTNVDNKTVYPDGDTSCILNYTQENVVIDKVGNVEIRSQLVTRSGTIIGLAQDSTYDVEVYCGTELSLCQFKADIRALGAMDIFTTSDFEYINETVVKIKVPEHFNSGYYCINGIGLFRYVNGDSYDENTNFNIPNENPEDSDLPEITYDPEDFVPSNTDVVKFNIEEIGMKEVVCTISFNNDNTGDGLPDVYATLITPSGERIDMTTTNTALVASFEAIEAGEYQVEIINLTDYRNASVEVIDIE